MRWMMLILLSVATRCVALEQPATGGPETMAQPGAGECMVLRGRCNAVDGGMDVTFGQPGKRPAVSLTVRGIDMVTLGHHWRTTSVTNDLPDAALDIRLSGAHGWDVRSLRKVWFIRPDLHFYAGEDFDRMLKTWQGYAPASTHTFSLELRRRGDRLAAWIDGRFLFGFDVPADAQVTLTPVGAGELLGATTQANPETATYLPLDLSVNRHQGPTTVTESSVVAGAQAFEDVPFHVLNTSNRVDVGLARWLRQAKDSSSFYDPYYRRSSWDNLPETIVFSVPRRHYTMLHLVCAVDPTLSPAMAIRLARYRQSWDGAGASQADVNVTIDPTNPEHCTVTPIGTVKLNGKPTPLFRVEVPVATGELADYLTMEKMDSSETPDFLYLEFTRTLHTRVCVNLGIFETKPLGPQSGVHLFAATLEEAPVDIIVDSTEVGNILYADQEPALRIRTRNPSAQAMQLSMHATFRDYWGTRTERTLDQLTAQPGACETPVPLRGFEPGWYAAVFAFRDTAGRLVCSQPLRLAILPPDTRRAGDESPFGIWWFNGSHYTEKLADRALPLVRKLGFRHVTPPGYDPKTGCTAENFATYQVTPSMMGRTRLAERDKAKGATVEQRAREYLKQWPSTKDAMVFHEAAMKLPEGIGLPPEILGNEFPGLDEEGREQRDKLMQHIEEHAGGLRSADPKLKIILGNSSTGFNVHWFREKLPRKYWDACGLEMAVQLFHPEGQPTGWNLQSIWIARRMADLYGYKDFPITSCYEFDYRATAAGGLSFEDQANWYARDVLHGLAYRMPNINVALLEDCNSSYYSSRWGSCGVLTRAPWLMPKPSFVTLATLTRVLDKAEYVGARDTGSLGLYCLEFARGKEHIYALWSSRGTRDVSLTLTGKASGKRVDSMGRETPFASGEAFPQGEAPAYVVASAAIEKVDPGTPVFEQPALQETAVIDPLGAEAWKTGTADKAFLDYCAYTPMTSAEMALAPLDQGTTVTLVSQPKTPALVARYATLEPKSGPIAIPGRPNRVGVWVRGNAGWGRIYFEVIDAKGRRWTSNGWEEAPNSWDMSDWIADTAINHEGWRFISMGLPLHYASDYYGPNFHNWRCQGDNAKDNRIAYPLTFNRLYVVLREEIVHGTDLTRVPDLSIGLRDLTVGTDPDALQVGSEAATVAPTAR